MNRFITKVSIATMIAMTMTVIIACLCYRFLTPDIRAFTGSCMLGSVAWTAIGLRIFIPKVTCSGIIKVKANPRLAEHPEEAPKDVFIHTPNATYIRLMEGTADIVIFDVINFEEEK